MSYDHRKPTRFSSQECHAAVGKRAVLPLTGRIVDAHATPIGTCVIFQLDERWGFEDMKLGLDLDALVVVPDGAPHE